MNNSNNLDFLRSVAVLLVVWEHLSLAIGKPVLLGRLGVLFFFVHTSLVLMLSLERLQLTGASLFRVFYIRRAFRIYSLSVLACAVMLTFHIPEMPELSFHMPAAGDIISNFLLIQNLTLTEPLLGPLWSLPLELQMYLILPVFYLFLKTTVSLSPLLWISLLSMALGLMQIRISYRLNILSFVPCFLGGILAFQLLKKPRVQLPAGLWPLVLAALIGLFVCLPGKHTSPPKGWFICLCAGCAIPFFREITVAPVVVTTKLVARYSYGVYISHVPILWLVFRKLDASLPLAMRWLVLFALLVLVPVMLYHCVEAPLIRVGVWLTQRSISPRRRQSELLLPVLSADERAETL